MARCSAVSDWWAIRDVLAGPLTCFSCPPPGTVRAKKRRDDSQVRACTGISLGFSPLRTRSTYPVLQRPQVVCPMLLLDHCNGLRAPIMVGINSDTVG